MQLSNGFNEWSGSTPIRCMICTATQGAYGTRSLSFISLSNSFNKLLALKVQYQSDIIRCSMSGAYKMNKVIALRGSTPKRESQQQCSYTNNTANHAMLCHTMTYNAAPYNLCNAIRCHTMQHHDHHAMQHHTTPFHAMQ